MGYGGQDGIGPETERGLHSGAFCRTHREVNRLLRGLTMWTTLAPSLRERHHVSFRSAATRSVCKRFVSLRAYVAVGIGARKEQRMHRVVCGMRLRGALGTLVTGPGTQMHRDSCIECCMKGKHILAQGPPCRRTSIPVNPTALEAFKNLDPTTW